MYRTWYLRENTDWESRVWSSGMGHLIVWYAYCTGWRPSSSFVTGVCSGLEVNCCSLYQVSIPLKPYVTRTHSVTSHVPGHRWSPQLKCQERDNALSGQGYCTPKRINDEYVAMVELWLAGENKKKLKRKFSSSSTSSTINLTWIQLEFNPGINWLS
jgi:hypothetical protein